MTAKTTEGLIGANAAVKEIRTPMKVFKEARARGDQATMKRAMGYAEKFNGDAWEHKARADEGLKQEAVEAKEKEKLQREELEQRLKENRAETEKRIEEARKGDNVVETSDGSENEKTELEAPVETAEAKIAPVTYTKEGDVKAAVDEVKFNVTV
ncbi:MAG: hypothetical protein NC394_10105 [Bacteroides sp.]|nr:hypothetical protein [Bacteroides sp.]